MPSGFDVVADWFYYRARDAFAEVMPLDIRWLDETGYRGHVPFAQQEERLRLGDCAWKQALRPSPDGRMLVYHDGKREQTTRPGRWIQRQLPWASPDLCGDFATQWTSTYAPRDVHFASTAEEIARVYIEGPTSCMDGRHFSEPRKHPCRVYAKGDLAIAYQMNDAGRIVARALCWPDRKVYGRAYGDEARLLTDLGRLGYRSGSLAGARIRRITKRDSGAIVMPYLDGSMGVRFEDADTWILVDEQDNDGIECQSQTGLAGEADVERCDNCEEPEDDCECHTCAACGGRMSGDDCHTPESGDGCYCEDCFCTNFFCCVECDEEYSAEDHVGNTPDGSICESCAEDMLQCPVCRTYNPADHDGERCKGYGGRGRCNHVFPHCRECDDDGCDECSEPEPDDSEGPGEETSEEPIVDPAPSCEAVIRLYSVIVRGTTADASAAAFRFGARGFVMGTQIHSDEVNARAYLTEEQIRNWWEADMVRLHKIAGDLLHYADLGVHPLPD